LLGVAQKGYRGHKKKGTTSMLAMNYRGPLRVRIDHKPMPEILHPADPICTCTTGMYPTLGRG
jgi:hypothetical protein